MRLEPRRSKWRGEDGDEEDSCAISPKWTYDRRTRRWRRLDSGSDFLRSADSPAAPREGSLCDISDRHDICSIHSSSSTESEGHEGRRKSRRGPGIITAASTSTGVSTASTTDDQETSRSSSRCSSANKTPSLDTSFSGPPSPSGGGGSLEAERRFPDKPPRRKGPGLLRKMEKLRLLSPGGSNVGSRARLLISGPVPVQEGSMEEDRLGRLQCPASVQGRPGSQASSSPSSLHTGSSGSSSNSPSGSSSTISTPSPVTRVRSN